MRFRDLITLAVVALWQQKLRATLTTLGVLFGSFVLVASLSVRIGVDKRIVEEFARYRELREIQVFPNSNPDADPPSKEIEVRGDMSDERRRRLREELKRQWRMRSGDETRVSLTQERLDTLRRIPHVQSVQPFLFFHGRAVIGDDAQDAMAVSAPVGDEQIKARIVTGTSFSASNAREVLVSEHLLYDLGVRDDADVENAIGRTLRLEFSGQRLDPRLLITLIRGNGETRSKAGDEKLLSKVVGQLPETLPKLELSDKERARLIELLKPTDKKENEKNERDDDTVLVGEFRIVGVFRKARPEETDRRGNWREQQTALFLPVDAMATFLFRHPKLRRHGFEFATVEVDDVANVESVTEEITSTGLGAQSRLRMVKHQQAVYGLIFSAMTVVAFVALLVAAMGITNTMIMSVLERVRQIGIMKAVGARDSHIQAIFLIEGALIGLLGGTAGVVLAYMSSGPGDSWVQSMVQRDMSIELHGSIFALPWMLLIGVPVFTTVVTTISAFFPARRAARVDPVTALRQS